MPEHEIANATSGLLSVNHEVDRPLNSADAEVRIGKYTVPHPGARIGRWTVLAPAPPRGKGGAYWLCRCSCGVTKEIRGSALRTGKSKSCGCAIPAACGERFRTHGQRRSHNARSAEYTAWINLKDRCENPQCGGYKYYGGRGITVCPEWRDSFEAFYRDMGRKPSPRHSIDRIDNDGPYAAWNCRWATWTEQARNRRQPRRRVEAGV